MAETQQMGMTGILTNQPVDTAGSGLSADSLFTPFSVKGLNLPNRIVMAPMTRNFSPLGIPGDNVAAYYRRRAEGGFGLIITEGTYIAHRSAGNSTHVPRLESEATVQAWRKVTDAVHQAGGHIMPQLWHIGIAGTARTTMDPSIRLIGPSGLNGAGEAVDVPMTRREIDAVIEAFGHSAAAAKRAGFDGIELHGAHGYLIDQFFWERTNRRTDIYGGDPVGRTRFAVEVIQECRAQVGPDFPIVLRYSQWKSADYGARLAPSPAELAAFLQSLADAGVDLFHCSERRYWLPQFDGSHLNLAGWTKKLTGKPVISVGSIGLHDGSGDASRPVATVDARPEANLAPLLAMLDRGEIDLAAIGRAAIPDPHWPALVRQGEYDRLSKYSRAEAAATLY